MEFKVPRKKKLTDPETGRSVWMTHTVVKTARPTDALYGNLQFKIVDGERILDLSSIHDVTPDKIDFPAGMEAIVMSCDLTLPLIPVQFNHEAGNYRGVWIRAEDLIYVAGKDGHHLDGIRSDEEEEEKV